MQPTPIKLLLIDDQEDQYFLIKVLLSKITNFDADLIWAHCYNDGLERLISGEFQLCLLDYHLGMDRRTGIDLLHQALSHSLQTPVIMLTACNDQRADIAALEAGAADFLEKTGLTRQLLERSLRYALAQAATLRALRQSQERYALAIAGANDGIWDHDLTSDILYVSPRWSAMLGYAPGQIGGNGAAWLLLVHPDDLASFQHQREMHLSDQSDHFEVEYRIRCSDGAYRWVLCRGIAVRNADGQPTRMAGSQTDISKRKQLERQLQYDALYDKLTSLPNRILLIDRLNRAIQQARRRSCYQFAVFFLDLDGFKPINDSLGHIAGDQLLSIVAERLSGCLRANDTAARLGGDEFVLIINDVRELGELPQIAQRILAQLERPIALGEHLVQISASIGIAVGSPAYTQAEELLRDSDVAMYRAKSFGPGKYELFNTPICR